VYAVRRWPKRRYAAHTCRCRLNLSTYILISSYRSRSISYSQCDNLQAKHQPLCLLNWPLPHAHHSSGWDNPTACISSGAVHWRHSTLDARSNNMNSANKRAATQVAARSSPHAGHFITTDTVFSCTWNFYSFSRPFSYTFPFTKLLQIFYKI